MADCSPTGQLAQVVLQCLAAGKVVEIDGLGAFYADAARGCRFEPSGLRHTAGFSPWTDARKLLPGQNWPRAIESAIETSDFFVACFSENSVHKTGGFQSEVRYALDCARRVPLDEIFVVPLRLDGCRVPRSIQREFQYVDFFPDWARGIRRLVTMMRRQVARRGRAR